MSIYDKSSLVLIPSGTKTGKVFSQKPVSGDGDFTFTRSSAATRVNADGNIEKETQNLLLQSNTFDTTWTSATTNASVTSGQADPNGGSTAWLVTEINDGGSIRQSTSLSGVLTFSMYLKYNSGATQSASLFCTDNNQNASFNLSSGSVTSENNLIDSSIQDIGGGWYRCSITLNASSASTMILFPNNASGVGSCFAWHAQLEQGLVTTDYQETTTAAVYGGITDNTPRLDYTDSSCPALLLEPLRTNSLPDSELFAGSNWSRLNVTAVSNNSLSPEGVSNASLIYPTTSGTDRLVEKVLSAQAGSTWTSSFFVKASGFDWVLVYAPNLGICYFNATTGQFGNVANSVTAKVLGQHNGFWRVSFTGVVGGSNAYFYAGVADANGTNVATANGTNGLLFYGAQLELGSYATSYIPCYGSSVTRVVPLVTDYNSFLAGLTDMAWFIDYTIPKESSPNFRTQFGYRDNVNANFYMVQFPNSNTHEFRYRGVAGVNVDMTPSIDEATYGLHRKLVYLKRGTTLKIFCNGVEVSSVTNANATTFSTSSEALQIGSNYPPELSVHQLLVFPTALTDQEAIDLTTI
jgi:hypothetical protein